MNYAYHTSGRNQRTAIVLGLYLTALLALYVILNAAWWIIAIFAVFALPAVWDLWSDRPSGVILDARRLQWQSGVMQNEVLLDNIKSVHFNTRFDFSVRVTLYLHSGAKIRLPWDCLPPHQEFEAAFQQVGVKTERHHFTLIS